MVGKTNSTRPISANAVKLVVRNLPRQTGTSRYQQFQRHDTRVGPLRSESALMAMFVHLALESQVKMIRRTGIRKRRHPAAGSTGCVFAARLTKQPNISR
jgi:hypothetical protein